MKKSMVSSLLAALALSGISSQASAEEMEKCKVLDSEGRGLIKANKTDCTSGGHNCAGLNAEGDPDAWIMVPKGQCEKINQGDFSGVSSTIKDKIERQEAKDAQEAEQIPEEELGNEVEEDLQKAMERMESESDAPVNEESDML